MIKFFRNIRQNMIKENRIFNYLLYAVGEIILVVIGILIALQINILQQKQLDSRTLNKYLTLLLEDLEKDKERLFECIKADSTKLEHCNQFINANKPIISHATFVYSLQQASIIIHDATYNSMKSSGIMELIKDIETQKTISEYYANLESTKRFEDIHLNNQVANYTNDVLKRKKLVRFFHQMNGPEDLIELSPEEESIVFGPIVNIRDIAKIEVGRYKNALEELDKLMKLIKVEIKEDNKNLPNF